MKKVENFLYGTQYYRAPTPLHSEWEKDLPALKNYGLNAFQIRVQWRQNEPTEGDYRFDDVDELLELAYKYNLKVVFKFLLENAPQYIFYKYGGKRRGFNGVPINPASHGAFYVGGWMPCFDNPFVKERAAAFVEECVKRYNSDNTIILWNAWNEPRSRPSEDCACEHSMREYRKWLKLEYRDIDNLNHIFGTREESFETIDPPGLSCGYWDYLLFRKWRAVSAVPSMVEFVTKCIKKYDDKRPVMSHAGNSSVVQKTVLDISDDFETAKVVDFYGTSYPVPIYLKTREDRIDCGLHADFLRHVNEYYFVHELYPDWGNWKKPTSVEDLRYKIWTVLSRGTKGICFWQYRAERLGCENNLSGLVNMDGTPNERTEEVGRIGRLIEKHGQLFMDMEVPHSDVAILYDFNSALISKVEETDQSLSWSFKPSENAPLYYYRAQTGMYRLFADLSIPVDFIDTRDLSRLENYKVVYAPCMEMVSTQATEKLQSFVENGGVLLADEGFGLRQRNTWLNTTAPYNDSMKFILAKWVYRVRSTDGDNVVLGDCKVPVTPYKTIYEWNDGICIANYDDGSPAIIKFNKNKGEIVLFGCSVGYSYWQASVSAWRSFIKGLISNLDIRKNPCDNLELGVESRLLECKNTKMIIVFNCSEKEQVVKVGLTDAVELTRSSSLDEAAGNLLIPPGQVACLVGRIN